MELGKESIVRIRLSPNMVTHMIRLGQVSSWITYYTRLYVPLPAILGSAILLTQELHNEDSASGAYVGADHDCGRLKEDRESQVLKSHARVCHPSLMQYCNAKLTYRRTHPR